MKQSLDSYGYTAAAVSALHIFDRTQKQTGRTTRTLAALQPKDILVVPCIAEYNRIKRLLARENKADVTIVVAPPDKPHTITEQLQSKRGRVVFSHDWFFLYLEREFLRAAQWPLTVADQICRPTDPDPEPFEYMGPPPLRQVQP